MSGEHSVAVDGDKQPVAENVAEQSDVGAHTVESQTSLDEVESDEHSVANIERIYR